jgi:integrase
VIDIVKRYRYLVCDRDRHGNARWYLRRPGQAKIRLRATPNTPEFDAAYRAAIEGPSEAPKHALRDAPAVPGTIEALIRAYYAGAEYKALAPRGQRVRRLVLDRFRIEHGAKRADKLEPRHLMAIRDRMAATPEAANALLKYLRVVWAFAGPPRNLVASDPTRAVRYLASRSPDGFRQWSLDDVAAFEAHWPIGSKPRLALALLLYTGQRRSDVIRLGRQHLRADATTGSVSLVFTQVKNAQRKPVRLSLPVIAELQRAIDACPNAGLTFLESDRGGAFTDDGFGNAFRRWATAAGLTKCSPHGLRKAAAARLAELGATAHEIAAVTGHRTLKEVARYTAGAAQKIMADSALGRLAQSQKLSHSGAVPGRWDKTEAQAIDSIDAVARLVPRVGAAK